MQDAAALTELANTKANPDLFAWPAPLSGQEGHQAIADRFNHLVECCQSAVFTLARNVQRIAGIETLPQFQVDDPEKAQADIMDQYARLAYEGYGRRAAWLTHDGKPMPPSFDHLSDQTQENWRAAVWAAFTGNVEAIAVQLPDMHSHIRVVMTIAQISDDPVTAGAWPFPARDTTDQPMLTDEDPGTTEPNTQ